ncbi:MAG TPA: DNA-binding domain-containing protein [Permianibacter sp.]|nr:DNA-binding domain-containing protein [Permianibacter sp.]
MFAEAQVAHAAFAHALLNPDASAPSLSSAKQGVQTTDQPQRFSVHRNNVIAGLVQVLTEGFPTTLQLLGDEYFRAVAAAFARASPPRSPVLSEYGERFPAFLAALPAVAPYPYVPDVAQLEWLGRRAFHSADAPVLTLAAVRALPLPALLMQSLRIHPAARWLRSVHPVVSLWRHEQLGESALDSAHWQAECALITRPEFTVRVTAISTAAVTLLEHVAAGEVLADAMASTGLPLAEVSQQFVALVQHGCFQAPHVMPANPSIDQET